MAPKQARHELNENSEPAPKRAKKQANKTSVGLGESLSIEVAMLSGVTVASLSVESSCSVRKLLDDKIIPLVENQTKGKIVRLIHQTEMLIDHQTLRDAGICTGAILTLTFEREPLKLRTIKREMARTDAAAKTAMLRSKMTDCEKKVTKAGSEAAKAREALAEQQAKVRSAEKALQKANSALERARACQDIVAEEMQTAKRDESTDYERVVEYLKSPNTPNTCLKLKGMNAMLDICALKAAGEVDDDELARVAEIFAASESLPLLCSISQQVGALKAIMSHLQNAVGVPSEGPFLQSLVAKNVDDGHLRALRTLSTSICASGNRSGADIPWIPLTQAICLTCNAAAALALVDGVAAYVEITRTCYAPRTYHCPLHSVMYPVILLLRSNSLPAVSRLEDAFAVELRAAHGKTAWRNLTEDICQNRDSAAAGPLVDGVIACARSMWRNAVCASIDDLHISNDPRTFPECPLLNLLCPILEKVRCAGFPLVDKLQAALRTELEIAVAEPLQEKPDYSMSAEAAAIGFRHPELRLFLLSEWEAEKTFNVSKAARMEIHRLIDGSGLAGKLTHSSIGIGHSRALIVRKVDAERKRREIEQKQVLLSKRKQVFKNL